jgi:hypothetical protein
MIKAASGRESDASVNCLLAALKEAQDSVRSYDSKAQIVGVGFIFTIGIITKLGASLPGTSELNMTGVILFWMLGIVPILMYGFVLYPSRNSVKSLQSYKEIVRHKFYISSERPRDLDTYLKDIGSGDWSAEIAYELIKVSSLRDLKRVRFIRALRTSAFSFSVVAVLQILRSSGLDILGRG